MYRDGDPILENSNGHDMIFFDYIHILITIKAFLIFCFALFLALRVFWFFLACFVSLMVMLFDEPISLSTRLIGNVLWNKIN